MDFSRVLSLSMRPKYLEDLVGQDAIYRLITEQFKSGRIPHFFILSGPIGSGKTTIARILALWLQVKRQLTEEDWEKYKGFDIQEINAANKNGINDIRELIENMRFKPMLPSKAKVVIMDEAHQITTPAQNALLTETEDVSNHTYYIFCTSNISKIIPALIRRAYTITPNPLSKESIIQLIDRAYMVSNSKKTNNIEELIDVLVSYEITSPGLILQATEKFIAGLPAIECISSKEITKLDTLGICRAVSSGDWEKTKTLCEKITKNDVQMLIVCINSYLKSILLKTNEQNGLKIANAIKGLSACPPEDIPMFFATIFLICQQLKWKK